ncbi:MAG: amidohydrolase [Ruminococcaceae bacterium]|nr:amidohydrolase [Oscillospiraceae bacterium]
MSTADRLMGFIDSVLTEITAIRRHVHRYPELSGEERETTAYICGILEKHGIVPRMLPDNSGFTAEVGSGEKVLGIRAELDAMPITEETGLPYASVHPGIMHACGHDIHLAAAVGFLLMLKPLEDTLPCRVRIFCQPAEETTGGAEKMIRYGCLENPVCDTVLGFHIDPSLPAGKAAYLPGVMNAAVTDFDLVVRGRSCHGAHPEQGIDAIVASAAVVSALQTVSARRFAPTTPVIVTVGTICGGLASNVVAGEVRMRGTLRALDRQVMENLRRVVRETAESAAAGCGASAEVVYTTGYPVLENNPAWTEAFFEKVGRHLGTDAVRKMDAPSLGADDFAFFCENAVSCYFNIGCLGTNDLPGQALHSSLLVPDENCMRTALEILCLAVEFVEERDV